MFTDGKLEIAIVGKFTIVNVLNGRTDGQHVRLFANCRTYAFWCEDSCIRLATCTSGNIRVPL